jgi:hypothetical protein
VDQKMTNPPQLPITMTMSQSRLVAQRLAALADDVARHFNLDPGVVRHELALACARYAVNAGVLDRERVPSAAMTDAGVLDAVVAEGSGDGRGR